MAIVFVSPKERQKILILAIVGFFVVILILISISIILARPKAVPIAETFIAPEIKINFDVLKSPQVMALKLLPDMERQFSYKADLKGKAKTGKIVSSSIDKAKETLLEQGYTNIIVEEIKIGRENPFTPYYELAPVKKTTKK